MSNKHELTKILEKRVSQLKNSHMCVVSRSPIMSETYLRIVPSENAVARNKGKNNGF